MDSERGQERGSDPAVEVPVVDGGGEVVAAAAGGGSVPVAGRDGDPADGEDPPGAEAAPVVDDPSVDGAGADETAVVSPPEADSGKDGPAEARVRGSRPSAAGVMIAVLLAVLGFTLVVQLRAGSADPTLASTRQEDLVRILSDLEAQQERLRQDIAGLEESQRQLTSGAQGRQAALEEAARRADELGILAGTLPARGPGLTVRFSPGSGGAIRASAVLDAVQELRGAGAEAMEIAGGDGAQVRVVASTYFLDADGGINVGGRRLVAPYTVTVIGDAQTMRTALNIAGGVVASVSGDGGNVLIEEHEVVEVRALSAPVELEHARPVS
jgi:uncharacterized protein YlxW (UPF0749 family)